MKYDDLFHMAHSNIGLNLTPIKGLKNEEYKQIIKEFGLNIDDFYKVEGKFYPYCYSKGTVFVEIYQISRDYFENFQVKEIISLREKKHKEYIENSNYGSLFCMIDKPFRFTFYEELFNKIPDEQKYEMFKFIYTSSEYGFESLSRGFLEKVFKYKTKTEKWFEEDIITVYRGEGCRSNYYKEAYSWTTDIEVAKFFATRFDNEGDLYKGKVKQSNILDYITDRKENEVLVYPEDVFEVELIK